MIITGDGEDGERHLVKMQTQLSVVKMYVRASPLGSPPSPLSRLGGVLSVVY